jgi:hypothetical protein
VPAFESLTANYSAYYFAHANALYTYVTEISSVSPEESSTLESSILNYEFTTSGNDTVSETQVALYYSNYTQVGANQTSLTSTFNDLVNETYIIACSVVGVNGAVDYLEVSFTVEIIITYTTIVTVTYPEVTAYNSTVPWQVDTSLSNDTDIMRQINVYDYLTGVAIGENQTSATGTFTIPTTGLYTFAVTATGSHGSSDYETVFFAVYVAESTGEILSIKGVPISNIIKIKG